MVAIAADAAPPDMIGMSSCLTPALALALSAFLAGSAAAQTVAPAPPYYAMAPASPATPYVTSPVQQQVLQNYRSQALQVQREMLQQNPTGLSPAQVELGHQLNPYITGTAPPPIASGSTAPPSPFDAAPFAPGGPAALHRAKLAR